VICGGGEEHPVPAPKTTANAAADSMINHERCRAMSSSYIEKSTIMMLPSGVAY